MSEPATAILVPVLARPHRIKPLLESIAAATPEPHTVLFIADRGDHAELQGLEDAGVGTFEGVGMIQMSRPVNWAAKVNEGYRRTTEPFIFIAADDLDFRPDWLRRALGYMTEGIGVVGTNDLCNPRVMTGQHSTHMLVRRSYIEERSGVVDQPDTVVHEGYAHEYADDELVQTAMARGAYAHAFDSLVEHLHPMVGKAPDDSTYERGRARTARSRRLFHRRRQLWASLA